jgi:hypothetical protein
VGWVRHLRVASTLATVLALLTTGAGCQRGCTQIGGDSGVGVFIAGEGRTGPVVVDVCVRAVCASASVAGTEGPVYVMTREVESDDPVEVVVTVRRQDGTVLVPATRATVVPERHQPNGPECEPTFYSATVTVTTQP